MVCMVYVCCLYGIYGIYGVLKVHTYNIKQLEIIFFSDAKLKFNKNNTHI